MDIEMTKAMRGEYTVLIVDDEPHIRRLVEVNLRAFGYNTRQATNGQECLDMVAENRPDIIVLDWVMPIKDGMETMRDLQGNPMTSEIPVIFLTAKGQDADIFGGWSSGASSYITKPFNPREILSIIDRLMLSMKFPYLDGEEPEGKIYDV